MALDPDTATTAQPGRLGMAGRQGDYWLTVYRRTWRGSVITSFLAPVLYVVAMGVLLGGFIEADPDRLEGATSYLAFVAPGLVAASSMQLVFGETTYPVMGMVKWQKIAFSMIATPLEPRDVLNANLGFIAGRVAFTSGIFLLVLAPFGIYESWWGALAALPVQVLVGMAFATPLYGLSAGLRNEAAFGVVFRLGMIPLFLFSGAFFPVANLPDWLEWLARVTPLWHGVDLTRTLTLGTIEAGPALLHVGYLLACAAVGYLWAVRRLTRRLVT